MTHSISKRFLTLLTLFTLGLFTSCGGETGGANVQIPGVKGPTVSLLQDNVVVAMTMENLQVLIGATYQVPKYKNSFIGLNPNLEGPGAVLTFTVSLDDIFDSDIGGLDPKTLPGGRPIPGVAAGALPAVAFQVEELGNAAFYVGPKFWGAWVPLPSFNVQGLAITYAYMVGDKRVGNLTLYGQDMDGQNAGFFLALSMNAVSEKRLKALSQKY